MNKINGKQLENKYSAKLICFVNRLMFKYTV